MQRLTYSPRLFFSSPLVRDTVLAARLMGKNPFADSIQQQKQERMGVAGIRECLSRVKYVRKMRHIQGLDILEPTEIAVTDYGNSPREQARLKNAHEELELTAEIARRYSKMGDLVKSSNISLAGFYYTRAAEYELACVQIVKNLLNIAYFELEHSTKAQEN